MLLNEGDNFLHMNCFQCIQFLFLSLQFHPFDTWLCKFHRHIEEYKHQTELSNKNIEQLRQKNMQKMIFGCIKKYLIQAVLKNANEYQTLSKTS